MGRTIKISELKTFDVFRSRPKDKFSWVCLGDGNYMLSNGSIVKKITMGDLAKEVELLGHMEFNPIRDEKYFEERGKEYCKNKIEVPEHLQLTDEQKAGLKEYFSKTPRLDYLRYLAENEPDTIP